MSDDCFKILVATDIHLGYKEKDAIRGLDSIITLEEILQIATKHNVDFLLLGGDLFHENKPSRKVLFQAINLLRKYCVGDKLHNFEFYSDPEQVLHHSKFKLLNYADPSMNIKLPIFSIHGNHDDPVGITGLCSLDILSACGLVNYFGKFSQIEKLEVTPLLFHKNGTNLALYGFGSIRDERLYNIYKEGRLVMMQPEESPQEWFNLMVIHQNRYKHGGATSYIPEHFIDNFVDLVVWGHEHECLIEPEPSSCGNFHISQPGSSVVTSLEVGESVPKHVALLKVRGKSFKLQPIPLTTVRPYVHNEVSLRAEGLDPSRDDLVYEYLHRKVLDMIEEAKEQLSSNTSQPKLPLIRLRVDYSGGFSVIKNNRFSASVKDLVANPDNVLLFRKKGVPTRGDEDGLDPYSEEKIKTIDSINSIKMEDLIEEYLQKNNNDMKLNVLSSKLLINSLNEFVVKDEKDSIEAMVARYITELQCRLQESFNLQVLEEQIQSIRTQFELKSERNLMDFTPAIVEPSKGSSHALLGSATTTAPLKVTSAVKRNSKVKKSPSKSPVKTPLKRSRPCSRKKPPPKKTFSSSNPFSIAASYSPDKENTKDNPHHDSDDELLALSFLSNYSKKSSDRRSKGL